MNRIIFTALAAAFAISTPAHALHKLYAPYVEEHAWEFEYFGNRSFDNDGSKDNSQSQQFAVGYGVNSWWKTELYAKFEREPRDELTFDAWEWENIFQLTQQGEYWLDVGASLAYEHTPQASRADALEGRLLLAKDWGQTSHIANIILEKEVGSGPKDGLEAGYILSSRYRYLPEFQPGLELTGDFGELKHTGAFDDHEHYFGPAAYGKIPVRAFGRSDAIEYRVGYLFGISNAAADGNLLLQLEYEIHF